MRIPGDAAKLWAEEALEVVRNSGGAGLVDWLTRQRPAFRCGKRRSLEGLLRYVEPRAWQMDYPRYRAAAWQIGTGMIESTAKQLVGLRLKGPGMHWTEAGAIAITALRAQNLNEQWHSFWNHLALAT